MHRLITTWPGFLCLALVVAAASAIAPPRVLTGLPFSAHMSQHMVLMDMVAPLLIAAMMGHTAFRKLAQGGSGPPLSATIHAAVMWGWHTPLAYQATMSDPLAHMAMSASFLVAGLIFWLSILATARNKPGNAIFWLFMSVMHTGFLGALLTFARRPFYAAAIDDQHLGGLIMWMLGSVVYGIAGLIIAARWLRDLERPNPTERAA